MPGEKNFCFSYLPADLKDANTKPSVPGIGVPGKSALGENMGDTGCPPLHCKDANTTPSEPGDQKKQGKADARSREHEISLLQDKDANVTSSKGAMATGISDGGFV